MKKIFYLFLALIMLAARCQKTEPIKPGEPANGQTSNSESPSPTTTPNTPLPAAPKLTEPLVNSLLRVTKKPFGIYITPQTSPVAPEKFKGYHTGTDFETFENEQDAEVAVTAVCDGKLALKKSASGYGGVAVQSCLIDDQKVTVLYGHLKLSSISLKVGDRLKAGEKWAVLGKGYSSETDGERKHLHLSIHKGTNQILLGYTQNKADLVNWLDVEDYLLPNQH